VQFVTRDDISSEKNTFFSRRVELGKVVEMPLKVLKKAFIRIFE